MTKKNPWLYFDYGSTGREHAASRKAKRAYGYLKALLRAKLHQYHMYGEPVPPEAMRLHGAIRWRGVKAFKKLIAAFLGLQQEEYLIEYGQNTIFLFSLVVDAIKERGRKALWATDFYEEWKPLLERLRPDLQPIDISDLLADVDQEFMVDRMVPRFVNRAIVDRPDVIFISLVTRDGYRMPVERIMVELREGWKEAAWGPFPLFVIDGCQAFSRVPLAMSRSPLASSCVYIGCMHKHAQGPQEFGFLVATNAAWLHDISRQLERLGPQRGLSYYFEHEGKGEGTPTVDVMRAIGAFAAMSRLPRNMQDRVDGWWALRQDLAEALKDTGWKVDRLSDRHLESGIITVKPPADKVIDLDAVVEYFESEHINLDVVYGKLRITLVAEHTRKDVLRLAATLKRFALARVRKVVKR